MISRHSAATTCLWCIVFMNAGSIWNPVNCVKAQDQPKIPSIIESQAKFFQYRHLPTPEDFEQGHRLGSDRHFIERHEKSSPAVGQFAAKVRWGDKKGGYGEHYWDLNHAGHVGNQGNDDYDDGSYHETPQDIDHSDEKSNNYESGNFNPGETSLNDENGRKKRADARDVSKNQKREHEELNNNDADFSKRNQIKINRPDVSENTDEVDDVRLNLQKPIIETNTRDHVHDHYEEQIFKPKDKNHILLVLNHKERGRDNIINPFNQKHLPHAHSISIRHRITPDAIASQSAPRFIIEHSTGHVVDRITGQTFILQPVPHYINYS